MECVEKLGLDWNNLDHSVATQLQMALGWIMSFVILVLQKCEKCLDSFYMMFVMC